MSSFKPRAEQHPDPDLLVGWSEGRLFATEAAPVESHLAGCDECRELIAGLGPRSTAPRSEQDPFGAAPPKARWPRFAAAAAAVVLAWSATLLVRDDRPQIEWAALAGSVEDLRGSLRSAPAGDELFVGLEVDQSAHVRIWVVLDDGAVLPVPLDTAGALHRTVEPGNDHSFGPYPTSFGADPPRSPRWFVIAVAEGNALEDPALPFERTRSQGDLERLVERIESLPSTRARIVPVEP